MISHLSQDMGLQPEASVDGRGNGCSAINRVSSLGEDDHSNTELNLEDLDCVT